MQSSEDRFRSEDPFKGQDYTHPDLDSMLDRITDAPLPLKRRGFASMTTRLVTAGVAATLLTVTAATVTELASTSVAVQAGPALHLSTAAQSEASNADTTPITPTPLGAIAFSVVVPSGTYLFTAPRQLNRLGTSSLAYSVVVPGTAHETAERFNRTFGSTPHSVTITAGTGLVPVFTLSVPSHASSAGTPTVRDRYAEASLRATVRRILSADSFNYGLGLPRVTSVGTQVRATFPVTVGGLATPYVVTLQVDGLGRVLRVSGPAFTVRDRVSYPLRTTTSGLSQLGTVPPGSAVTMYGFDSAATPVFHASVLGPSLSLAPYLTTRGTVWLLPTYTYAATFSYGGHTFELPRASTRVLAVAPSKIHAVPTVPTVTK
jgi:hypothetical protein